MKRLNRVAAICGLISTIAVLPSVALSQTEKQNPVFVGQLGGKDLVLNFFSSEVLNSAEV